MAVPSSARCCVDARHRVHTPGGARSSCGMPWGGHRRAGSPGNGPCHSSASHAHTLFGQSCAMSGHPLRPAHTRKSCLLPRRTAPPRSPRLPARAAESHTVSPRHTGVAPWGSAPPAQARPRFGGGGGAPRKLCAKLQDSGEQMSSPAAPRHRARHAAASMCAPSGIRSRTPAQLHGRGTRQPQVSS